MSNMPTSTIAPESIADLTSDPFAPAAFETLFLRPRYLVDTSSVAHVPFLFWACATQRMREVAVMGAGDGVLHFALCQMLEGMKDGASCVGYGFWKNDEETEQAHSVPPALAKHQEMLYEEISQLSPQADLDALIDNISEASLDLLLLDLAASPNGLAQRAEALVGKLRKGGVLFVHGETTVTEDSPDAAALERFTKAHESVHFATAQGFRMYLPTGEMPHHLGALLEASKNGRPPLSVEKVFRRVGEGLLGIVRASAEQAARVEAEDLADKNRTALKAVEDKLQNLDEAYYHRTRKVAQLESQLFDSRATIAELRAQMSAREAEMEAVKTVHQSEIDKLGANYMGEIDEVRSSYEARIEQLETRLAGLTAETVAEIEDLKAARESEIGELKSYYEARLAELGGELSNELDERVAALAKETARREAIEKDLKAANEARFSETTALTRMTETLRAEIATLKRAHGAALNAQEEEFAKRQHVIARLAQARDRLTGKLLQLHRFRVRMKAIEEIEANIRRVESSELFDAEWYAATYADLAEGGVEPARHFVLHGGYELRNPGPNFDSYAYHRAYEDVTEAGVPAFIHFVENGHAENRQTFSAANSA